MNKKRTNLEIMLNHYHAKMNEIREQEAIDPLGLTETIEVTIELSTGGPADGSTSEPLALMSAAMALSAASNSSPLRVQSLLYQQLCFIPATFW